MLLGLHRYENHGDWLLLLPLQWRITVQPLIVKLDNHKQLNDGVSHQKKDAIAVAIGIATASYYNLVAS